MKVKWLKKALINLEYSAAYLNERNPQAARDFVKEVYNLIELLKENPSMGRSGRVIRTRELILQQFPYLTPY